MRDKSTTVFSTRAIAILLTLSILLLAEGSGFCLSHFTALRFALADDDNSGGGSVFVKGTDQLLCVAVSSLLIVNTVSNNNNNNNINNNNGGGSISLAGGAATTTTTTASTTTSPSTATQLFAADRNTRVPFTELRRYTSASTESRGGDQAGISRSVSLGTPTLHEEGKGMCRMRVSQLKISGSLFGAQYVTTSAFMRYALCAENCTSPNASDKAFVTRTVDLAVLGSSPSTELTAVTIPNAETNDESIAAINTFVDSTSRLSISTENFIPQEVCFRMKNIPAQGMSFSVNSLTMTAAVPREGNVTWFSASASKVKAPACLMYCMERSVSPFISDVDARCTTTEVWSAADTDEAIKGLSSNEGHLFFDYDSVTGSFFWPSDRFYRRRPIGVCNGGAGECSSVRCATATDNKAPVCSFNGDNRKDAEKRFHGVFDKSGVWKREENLDTQYRCLCRAPATCHLGTVTPVIPTITTTSTRTSTTAPVPTPTKDTSPSSTSVTTSTTVPLPTNTSMSTPLVVTTLTDASTTATTTTSPSSTPTSTSTTTTQTQLTIESTEISAIVTDTSSGGEDTIRTTTTGPTDSQSTSSAYTAMETSSTATTTLAPQTDGTESSTAMTATQTSLETDTVATTSWATETEPVTTTESTAITVEEDTTAVESPFTNTSEEGDEGGNEGYVPTTVTRDGTLSPTTTTELTGSSTSALPTTSTNEETTEENTPTTTAMTTGSTLIPSTPHRIPTSPSAPRTTSATSAFPTSTATDATFTEGTTSSSTATEMTEDSPTPTDVSTSEQHDTTASSTTTQTTTVDFNSSSTSSVEITSTTTTGDPTIPTTSTQTTETDEQRTTMTMKSTTTPPDSEGSTTADDIETTTTTATKVTSTTTSNPTETTRTTDVTTYETSLSTTTTGTGATSTHTTETDKRHTTTTASPSSTTTDTSTTTTTTAPPASTTSTSAAPQPVYTYNVVCAFAMEVEAVRARLGFLRREMAALASVPPSSVVIRRLYAGSAVIEAQILNCTEAGAAHLVDAVRRGDTTLVTVLGALADAFDVQRLTDDPALQQVLAVLIVATIAISGCLTVAAALWFVHGRVRQAQARKARTAALEARKDEYVGAEENMFVLSGGVLHFNGVPLSMLGGGGGAEPKRRGQHTAAAVAGRKTSSVRGGAGGLSPRAWASPPSHGVVLPASALQTSPRHLVGAGEGYEEDEIVGGAFGDDPRLGGVYEDKVMLFTDAAGEGKVQAANAMWEEMPCMPTQRGKSSPFKPRREMDHAVSSSSSFSFFPSSFRDPNGAGGPHTRVRALSGGRGQGTEPPVEMKARGEFSFSGRRVRVVKFVSNNTADSETIVEK